MSGVDKGTSKKLNGEAKVLFDNLSYQRNEDRKENIDWKKEHNRSAKEFRDEIKDAISEIWRAMREGFDRLGDVIVKKTGNGTDWKMISIMISICLLIVTLLGARIISLEESMSEFKIESRVYYDKLENNLQRQSDTIDKNGSDQVKNLHNTLYREIEKILLEINRIRSWKDKVEQHQGTIDATQTTELQNIKILLEAKASDRFTGAEGKMMQRQIDRLEDRLTCLTKNSLEDKP